MIFRLRSAQASAVLLIGVTFLLLSAYFAKSELNFAAILGFCAGATFAILLGTFEYAIAEATGSQRAQASFDPELIRRDLNHLMEFIKAQKDNKLIEGMAELIEPEIQPWELRPSNLVRSDPVLALAQLRLSLEKELRRIANDYEIKLGLRHIGITSLARQLLEHELISKEAYTAIQDIALVCNQAIHGIAVSNETAETVVDIGDEVLSLLANTVTIPDPSSTRL